MTKNINLAIIGLGYVGLPLALEFGKKLQTVGYEINEKKVNELKNGVDSNGEVSVEEFKLANKLTFSNDENDLVNCNYFIVAVPTPIDNFNNPDLTPMLSATKTVAKALKKGDIVIYESTVYPGCVEDDCVPLLEKLTGLKFNEDFFCGYSPERINPGDKEHTLTNIVKVTSGSTPEVAKKVDDLYKMIIKAGTFPVDSIKIAEASKLIENTQRDLNISFVNQLSLVFDKMGIDTYKVLDAAGTKWNFLKFKPGLVGGHCIGVDPYYLVHKAKQFGVSTDLILEARKINESIPKLIVDKFLKNVSKRGFNLQGSKFLILGITFKENCSDIRNSKVVDIISQLKSWDVKFDVHDAWADPEEVKHEYDIDLVTELDSKYDGIILAVSHEQYLNMNLREMLNSNGVIFDVKGVLKDYDLRL